MATTKRTTKRKNGHATNEHLATKFKNGLKSNRKTLKAATRKLTHAASEAKERFTEVEDTVQKYAKANPWKTMGMTLLAGVVVGQIFGMRK